MKFADLGLSEELLQAVETAGYDTPTPIQAQAIPAVQMMKDIIGIAQTGTGKTASFVLPMIDILAHGRRRALMPRSLILEPTRELAAQVAENFEKYGKHHDLKMALLIGGVQMGDQVKALNEGVDVLIATPGRLMDLFERGKILLNGCDLLVIDEADRMLDMGFIPDLEFICEKLPPNRQTLLFSATMPPPIEKLADKFLNNPKKIEVARPASANTNIAQHKVMVNPRKKREALRQLLKTDDVQTAIVFSNRKTTVRELAKWLAREGFKTGEIHGDIDQNQRNAELQRFKDGVINILVASDVAARGLDIKGVSHIFNFDTPWHPDDYVQAIANVEKLTGMKIPVYDLAKGSAAPQQDSTPQDRGDAPAKKSKPKREPRAKQDKKPEKAQAKPRSENSGSEKPQDEKSRSEKPEGQKPKREQRSEAPEAPAKNNRDDGQDEGWNGPVPGFLAASTGD